MGSNDGTQAQCNDDVTLKELALIRAMRFGFSYIDACARCVVMMNESSLLRNRKLLAKRCCSLTHNLHIDCFQGTNIQSLQLNASLAT